MCDRVCECIYVHVRARVHGEVSTRVSEAVSSTSERKVDHCHCVCIVGTYSAGNRIACRMPESRMCRQRFPCTRQPQSCLHSGKRLPLGKGRDCPEARQILGRLIGGTGMEGVGDEKEGGSLVAGFSRNGLVEARSTWRIATSGHCIDARAARTIQVVTHPGPLPPPGKQKPPPARPRRRRPWQWAGCGWRGGDSDWSLPPCPTWHRKVVAA